MCVVRGLLIFMVAGQPRRSREPPAWSGGGGKGVGEGVSHHGDRLAGRLYQASRKGGRGGGATHASSPVPTLSLYCTLGCSEWDVQ